MGSYRKLSGYAINRAILPVWQGPLISFFPFFFFLSHAPENVSKLLSTFFSLFSGCLFLFFYLCLSFVELLRSGEISGVSNRWRSDDREWVAARRDIWRAPRLGFVISGSSLFSPQFLRRLPSRGGSSARYRYVDKARVFFFPFAAHAFPKPVGWRCQFFLCSFCFARLR